MHNLSTYFYLAKEMGERLGSSEVLLKKMSTTKKRLTLIFLNKKNHDNVIET